MNELEDLLDQEYAELEVEGMLTIGVGSEALWELVADSASSLGDHPDFHVKALPEMEGRPTFKVSSTPVAIEHLLQEMRDRKIPHLFFWEDAPLFNSELEAFDGSERYWVRSEEGRIMVTLDPDTGELDPEELANAKLFIEIRKQVLSRLAS